MSTISKIRLVFAAVLVALLFASPGSAATLSISADKALYAPGEVVTLTVTGNSGGASAIFLYGQVEFDPAGLLDPHAITFTPESGGAVDWTAGYLGCPDPLGTPGSCWLLNYIAYPPDPLPMDPIEQTLAIVTATAGAPGLYSVDWVVDSGFARDPLDFFGLNSAPGVTVGIFNASFQVIPEPSTALLVALGIAALGRRRRG